jgi:hypothetical protein
MQRAIVLVTAAVLVGGSQISHARTCGTTPNAPGDSVREVRLLQLPQEPSFYYRADDYVIFLPQDDVHRYFAVAASSSDPMLRRLAQQILADIPVAAPQDLFRYNLRDWLYGSYINAAVVELLTDGHASISDLVGVRINQVTIVHSEGPGFSGTAVHIGGKKTTTILGRVECVAPSWTGADVP